MSRIGNGLDALAANLVAIRWPHSDDEDYHQWITFGDRVRADSRGRRSPRMYEANWTEWVCNGDCGAIAWVHDQATEALIEAAEARREKRGSAPGDTP